jgi:uncharacterized protein YjbI with pentapeptide repeats
MANETHLDILKLGVQAWNKWREANENIRPDLSGADLFDADMTNANLSKTNLRVANLKRAKLGGADLRGADLYLADMQEAGLGSADLRNATLTRTNLNKAYLSMADLSETDLVKTDLSSGNLNNAKLNNAKFREVNLSEANLTWAHLEKADLFKVDLSGANLSWAKLKDATLREVDLRTAIMVETDFSFATLRECWVYGISAWGLNLTSAHQESLTITEAGEPLITVDHLEVAQFIYLILQNKKLRDVISAIGRKGVLILGRFSIRKRKKILDALREQLRQKGFLPIVFDFDKAAEKDFTETILVLAGLCLFVIADLTNPKSSPLEVQATIPNFMIPFVPIIERGEPPFAMFVDLQHKYHWVMEVREYDSRDHLIANFENAIIKPAIKKHNELIGLKTQDLKIKNIEEFRS